MNNVRNKFQKPVKKLEKMSRVSNVDELPAKKHSSLIADMQLQGALHRGRNFGYHFENDKYLPKRFDTFQDIRKMDVFDKLDLLGYVNGRIKEAKEFKFENEKKEEEKRKMNEKTQDVVYEEKKDTIKSGGKDNKNDL